MRLWNMVDVRIYGILFMVCGVLLKVSCWLSWCMLLVYGRGI
jgi:hypothetical protein